MQSNKKPELPSSYFAILWVFLFIFVVGGCVRQQHDGAPHYHVDMSRVHEPVPHYVPKSKYGNNDYWVKGRRYHVLSSEKGYDKIGMASWYGTLFDGRLTSTREKYSLLEMTAASPELPIPCFVRVTNLQNGNQVIVKVNDRGPFAANRIMDLSYVAAKKLGYAGRGTAMIRVTSIDTPNPLEKKIEPYSPRFPQYYLQVGAFSSVRNAEGLESRLRHVTAHETRIIRGHLYRVQIGPLKSAEESHTLQARIQHARLGHAISIVE